jgi:hypothetical protein
MISKVRDEDYDVQYDDGAGETGVLVANLRFIESGGGQPLMTGGGAQPANSQVHLLPTPISTSPNPNPTYTCIPAATSCSNQLACWTALLHCALLPATPRLACLTETCLTRCGRCPNPNPNLSPKSTYAHCLLVASHLPPYPPSHSHVSPAQIRGLVIVSGTGPGEAQIRGR